MDNVEGDRSSQEAELHVAQVTPGSVMRSSAVSRPAVGAGVLAMVVSFVGSWIPLFWYDEMATLSAARRSPDELLRLVGNVDAVHGLYYALMSGWLRLVPDTTLWVRLPGVLAIGVAGAGVFVLTWMVSTPSTAWIAAVVFAVLPATVQTAVEARPYAFTMAAAVWSTVALVSLIRALLDDRRWWPYAVGYVALIVLAVLFASLSLLILGAHAVTVLLAARTRRVVGVFALCAVTATALVSPLVLEVSRQSGQVDWISRFHYSPVLRMNDVAFPYAPQLTLLVLVVLAWGLVRMVRRRGGGAEDVDMSESATSRPDRLPPSLPAVAGPWLVVPPILLALYSLLVTPAFVTRYLTSRHRLSRSCWPLHSRGWVHIADCSPSRPPRCGPPCSSSWPSRAWCSCIRPSPSHSARTTGRCRPIWHPTCTAMTASCTDISNTRSTTPASSPRGTPRDSTPAGTSWSIGPCRPRSSADSCGRRMCPSTRSAPARPGVRGCGCSPTTRTRPRRSRVCDSPASGNSRRQPPKNCG